MERQSCTLYVPSACLDGKAVDFNALSDMVGQLPVNSEKSKCKGVDRGINDVRLYSVWNPYTPGEEPRESGDFIREGPVAQEFVKATEPLWNYAGVIKKEVFSKAHGPRYLYSIFSAKRIGTKGWAVDGDGDKPW